MFRATVTISPQKVIGEVHPHLYGANLEHIGQSVYGGVWAEMLRDRKFAGHDRPYIGLSEGLDHQHPSFGVVSPWEAVHPDRDRVLFVHDNTTFYTGRQSQRVTILDPDGKPHGVMQTNLALQAGRSYHCRLVLRGEAQTITVRLGEEAWQITADGRWTTHEHTFVSTLDQTAGLEITATTGTFWIGCASLMPDNLNGFRPDVIAAIRDLGPTFLRWPGGNFASAYHWQAGLGDKDKRSSYLDPAWNAWEPNDVGICEFIDLCRILGTEPILTVNMGNGDAEEAAAWVEFCNGGPETRYGRERLEAGYETPFGVTTWFVGNEQFGNWQVGHVDAETYAQRYLEFATAMRAASPLPLKLIAVGVPTDLYGRWNELVLKQAANEIDELSVHYYSIRTEKWDTPPPSETLYLPKVAAACEVEEMLDDTLDIIARHSTPPVPLAFDEWNTYVAAKAPDFLEDYDMADALYVGALMNACLRRADRIHMSAVFNLINVMGNFRVTPTQVWETPSNLVIKLLTRYRGNAAVQTECDSPMIASPAAGNLPALDTVPLVDAAATHSVTERTLYLSLVNREPEHEAEVTLRGIRTSEAIQAYVVEGDSLNALNDQATPHRVRIEPRTFQPAATLVLRPHSFTLAVIRLAF